VALDGMELICEEEAATGVTARQTPMIATARMTIEQIKTQLFALIILPSRQPFSIQTGGQNHQSASQIFSRIVQGTRRLPLINGSPDYPRKGGTFNLPINQ
jgi:hypothetical protein